MTILTGHATRGRTQSVKCDVWEGMYHLWIGDPDESGHPTRGASISIDPKSIPNETVRQALEALCTGPR